MGQPQGLIVSIPNNHDGLILPEGTRVGKRGTESYGRPWATTDHCLLLTRLSAASEADPTNHWLCALCREVSPGVVLKQVTARNVVSHWDVLDVHTQAMAAAVARTLHTPQERMPFPAGAIQVDGGRGFQATIEAECQRRGIPLFILPPQCLKLNGHVERAQRTHAEEFHPVIELPDTIPDLNRLLQDWERLHNTIRPHDALGYLTPAAFLHQFDASHPIRNQEVYGRQWTSTTPCHSDNSLLMSSSMNRTAVVAQVGAVCLCLVLAAACTAEEDIAATQTAWWLAGWAMLDGRSPY
ncbi:unnamed protein product [marine sediment metagenome]|uniref:Integrase catalytic domain-containing protein n=1 Tax=marine sediment metagenome TaxID=412755 RepID=X0SEL2_9ZZZZ